MLVPTPPSTVWDLEQLPNTPQAPFPPENPRPYICSDSLGSFQGRHEIKDTEGKHTAGATGKLGKGSAKGPAPREAPGACRAVPEMSGKRRPLLYGIGSQEAEKHGQAPTRLVFQQIT